MIHTMHTVDVLLVFVAAGGLAFLATLLLILLMYLSEILEQVIGGGQDETK